MELVTSTDILSAEGGVTANSTSRVAYRLNLGPAVKQGPDGSHDTRRRGPSCATGCAATSTRCNWPSVTTPAAAGRREVILRPFAGINATRLKSSKTAQTATAIVSPSYCSFKVVERPTDALNAVSFAIGDVTFNVTLPRLLTRWTSSPITTSQLDGVPFKTSISMVSNITPPCEIADMVTAPGNFP